MKLQEGKECRLTLNEKKELLSSNSFKYIDVGFVLGSAAKVERAFNTAKLILTQHRREMSPEMFEEFFPEAQPAFMDTELVVEAIDSPEKDLSSGTPDVEDSESEE